MAQRIQLPDGRFAQFPDDMPVSQIEAVLAQQFPPTGGAPAQPSAVTEETIEDPGFFERIGTRLEGRVDDFNTIVDAFQESQQEIFDDFQFDATLQTKIPRSIGVGVADAFSIVGKVIAGGLVDVVGEGVSTVAGGAFDVLKGLDELTATDEERARRDAELKVIFDDVAGSDLVQKATTAAGEGFEAYQAWTEKNPRAARTVEAAANIALVLAPVKGKPAAAARVPKPTVVGRAGAAMGAGAKAQTARERSSFIKDLVRPLTSKKVREAEILRTAEGAPILGKRAPTIGMGVLGKRTVTPSPAETAMANAVATIPAVTAKNTRLQNLGAIQSGITQEARKLEGLLGRSPARIPQQTIKTSLDDAAARLAANPILVGDAARTGKRTLDKAASLMAENPNTPIGVLKSRRQFDAWVKSQRPKVFDPATESALSTAVRESRQTMNDLIATHAPGVAVKNSLSKQSALFNAVENIGPKAAEEAATAVGRLMQRVDTAIGLPKRLINISIEDMVTATAKTAVSVGPAISKAATKELKGDFAFLLRTSEKAIQIAKKQGPKGATALRQLRADRAAVVEIVKAGQGDK